MNREELEKWITVLKEKNPLGMPLVMFDVILEEKNKFITELQIARFINRLLPEEYEKALRIYIDVLNHENIERELKENRNDNLEKIIEEIIWSYMDAATIFQNKEVDLKNAFKYIDEGIYFMNRYPIKMTYISRGEIYYIRWKILEQLGEIERVFEEVNALLK